MQRQIGDKLCWAAICEACQDFHKIVRFIPQCEMAEYISGGQCCIEYNSLGKITSNECNIAKPIEEVLTAFVTRGSSKNPVYHAIAPPNPSNMDILVSYLAKGPIPVTIGWLDSSGGLGVLNHYLLLIGVARTDYVALLDPWTPDESARLVQMPYSELLTNYRSTRSGEARPPGSTPRGRALAFHVIQ
jgi:hypothetical protein